MRIIGHRGVASLAPENTIEGIKTAIKVGVDAIEFDLRKSKDGVLVLNHDNSLLKSFGIDEKISSLTFAELRKLKNSLGQHIATLEDVIKISKDKNLFIECKGSHWADALADVMKKYLNEKRFTIISFNHLELFNFGKLCPEIPLYGLENHNPFDVINTARLYGLKGIDVNFWTLNPLAYMLARRHKLDIIVYTVNKPWMAQFIRILYPQVGITTDVPQKMQFLRSKRKDNS